MDSVKSTTSFTFIFTLTSHLHSYSYLLPLIYTLLLPIYMSYTPTPTHRHIKIFPFRSLPQSRSVALNLFVATGSSYTLPSPYLTFTYLPYLRKDR